MGGGGRVEGEEWRREGWGRGVEEGRVEGVEERGCEGREGVRGERVRCGEWV